MAIIGAAIFANITNIAIMATMAWPLMCNNKTIFGVFPENRQNVDQWGKRNSKMCFLRKVMA